MRSFMVAIARRAHRSRLRDRVVALRERVALVHPGRHDRGQCDPAPDRVGVVLDISTRASRKVLLMPDHLARVRCDQRGEVGSADLRLQRVDVL
jgi:hypothetical protein